MSNLIMKTITDYNKFFSARNKYHTNTTFSYFYFNLK